MIGQSLTKYLLSPQIALMFLVVGKKKGFMKTFFVLPAIGIKLFTCFSIESEVIITLSEVARGCDYVLGHSFTNATCTYKAFCKLCVNHVFQEKGNLTPKITHH